MRCFRGASSGFSFLSERLGVSFWAVGLSFSYPTPPSPSIYKNIWNQQLAGYDRRNSLQNIHNKDLISQNPESMGLMGRFLTASAFVDIAPSTPSAGTMMERIGGRAQGQMSQGGVEKAGLATSSRG
jgi:hypothetical protein